jgi:phospholipase/carboxylesterase
MEKIHDDQKVLTEGLDLEDEEKAVVMVHGRGASAHSMLQLVDQLPEAAYLAPQASRRTWYPQSFLEPREKNQPHLDSALRKVGDVVEKASKFVGLENVVILGFSQGACLASEFVASNPEKYGGVVLLSGGLIGDEIGDFEGDMEETPVFFGCAEEDPHIPFSRVDETVDVFENLNTEIVEKYVLDGSHHGIVEHELKKASEIIEGSV